MSEKTSAVASEIVPLPDLTGEAFRSWREGTGWSQAQAGAMLGVSSRTVRSWERVQGPLDRLVTLAVAHLNTVLDAKPQSRRRKAAAA